MGTVVEGPNCPETCVLDSETNSTQELAQSNSLAAGEELVTGSKVPSHLLQLEIRTLVEFVLHSFILVELFFVKKYLLVGAYDMLWTGGSVDQRCMYGYSSLYGKEPMSSSTTNSPHKSSMCFKTLFFQPIKMFTLQFQCPRAGGAWGFLTLTTIKAFLTTVSSVQSCVQFFSINKNLSLLSFQ